MCNIKQQTRQPPISEHKTWTIVDGRRVRVIFNDESVPTEPHIIVQRPDIQPPPPSKAMINWINGLRAKYSLGGI